MRDFAALRVDELLKPQSLLKSTLLLYYDCDLFFALFSVAVLVLHFCGHIHLLWVREEKKIFNYQVSEMTSGAA
jgi:hypothetical protein